MRSDKTRTNAISERRPRDIFTKPARKSIRGTRAATRGLIIPGLSRKFRDGVSPGAGGLRSKKRDAQSNLYASLSMLCTPAVWRWTYRYTGAVARGAGVYESIKTHPRQAPARRGPRGWKNASGVNALIMSYRGAG